MSDSPVGHTMYRIWWSGGGYSHVESLPYDPRAAKHKDPKRTADEPVRIDKVEIIFYDSEAEYRYNRARIDKMLGSKKEHGK